MADVTLIVDGTLHLRGGAVPLRSTSLLLAGIAETRSVRGAAERLDLSYRAAWGRLAALEATLGRTVAVKTKGHGSTLTPFGEDVLQALQATLDRFGASLADEQRALADRLNV